jgi:hypothetical protein
MTLIGFIFPLVIIDGGFGVGFGRLVEALQLAEDIS